MEDMIEIKRTKGRVALKLNAIHLGEDLCIIITGGDKPHLGAVTVGSKEVKSSTFCFPNHKEDYITRVLYDLFTSSFDKNVVLCCGIHVDNIMKSEIDTISALCIEMIEELKNIINI